MALVILVCDRDSLPGVQRAVERQGYESRCGLRGFEPGPPRDGSPNLGVLVSDPAGLEGVGALDAASVRYWLLFVGYVPRRWRERLPRQPHAMIPSPEGLGGKYLARLLDDWRERDKPRLDCFHFSFRSGAPPAADWVLDVRFLDSPHWVPELRAQSPRAEAVVNYVTGQEGARLLLRNFTEMITRLLPYYAQQRRTVIRVAVGCTGGEHRSQAMTEALVRRLNRSGVATARRLEEPPVYLPAEPGYLEVAGVPSERLPSRRP